MRVFKFGGASVKGADEIKNLGNILINYLDEPLLVVVSAMGKTTNALEEIATSSFNGENYDGALDRLTKSHHDVCSVLFGEVPEKVNNLIINLTESLKVRENFRWEQFYDLIIPFGELLSTTIVEHYISLSMRSIWLDARKFIKTDSQFTEASIAWDLTEQFISRDLPKLLQQGPVITQGFIGSDSSGYTTTLGREGSDFTGAIFAYCLRAHSLTVWKDVPGLLNADPKKFPSAELFSELSFQEVTELTYYGAKVIHPKTIRPLAQRNIPLFVKSFVHPEGAGTKISAHEKFGGKACFVFKENQLLITLRVRDNSFMDEKQLGKVFMALDHLNVKINMMHCSALTFTFCMDFKRTKLDGVLAYLEQDFQVLYNEGLEMATIKNYTDAAFELLPPMGEIILEQKTRNNFQVVYKS